MKHNINLDQLKKIRNFIRVNTGINFEDEKLTGVFKRKISEVIKNEGYPDFETFYQDIILKKNKKLIEKLINAITVNETYFFREEYQFEDLINYVIPELDKIRPPSESINILSAPCSTGEEVYSIAIYLLEEGHYIKKRDFVLLGIDIDSSAIKKAKEGLYSERSLHKVPEELKKKYFIKEGNMFRVIPFLRNAVSFEVVNVLDRYKMKKLGKFDVIFSRNMLIYFDEINRNETIATFHSILKEGGYLFLGHAERIPPQLKLFKPVKLGKSIVYRKEG